MKRKVLALCFVSVFSFATILSFAERQSTVLDPGSGSGNQATCYSTYSSPLIGGGTNIWRCGSCVSVSAKNFSDPGVCNF